MEEEILKYVEGENVSKSFLSRLENDIELQKQVTLLKSDIKLMNTLKDSPLFYSIEEKSRLVIKNNTIKESLFFSFVTPLLARGENKNIIYSFKNIEVNIIEGEVILMIEKIENYLKIHKDKKLILNIEAKYNNYRLVLDRGCYLVETDNNISEIIVK